MTPPSRQASQLLTPELRAALRAEFPYLANADFDAAMLLGEGWSVTALRMRDLVVRVARPNPPREVALERETALLAALEASAVPFVPRSARVLRDHAGAAFANAYEFIEGTPAPGGPLRGARRERLARDLGAFLGALHAFPVTRARALGVPEQDLWAELYVPLLATCRPHLGKRTRASLDAVVTQFLAMGGTRAAPRTLIHSDIWGANLLLDPTQALVGVIDFSDAMIADPALDFAGLLNDWPASFLDRVLTHYPPPVDDDARRRAAFYIAVALLFDLREGVRRGDRAMIANARRILATRLRAAVVRPAVGP